MVGVLHKGFPRLQQKYYRKNTGITFRDIATISAIDVDITYIQVQLTQSSPSAVLQGLLSAHCK